MVVLEYLLECGCALTVMVPAAEVEAEQVTGDIRVRCVACGTVRVVRSVQLRMS